MFRSLFAGVALALCARESAAQITTYVTPPRSTVPQVIAAADSARRDSIATATMTNMKAWVDSAAGVAVPAQVGDSVALAPGDPGRPAATTFADGAVAPATASNLPLLGLVGIMAIGLGAVMVRTRPRRP